MSPVGPETVGRFETVGPSLERHKAQSGGPVRLPESQAGAPRLEFPAPYLVRMGDQPNTSGMEGRELTDESLHTERSKTDSALEHSRGVEDAGADELIETARESADEMTRKSRDQADARLAEEGARTSKRRAVDAERAIEDSDRVEARAVDDTALGVERRARRLAFDDLFAAERARTDEHLNLERVSADESVAFRDDFLAMVAHDLRTMVSGIALHAEIIKRRAEDQSSPTMKTARHIKRLTRRVARLVEDLLDLASIEAGKLKVDPHPQKVQALLVEAFEAFQHHAVERGIQLEMDAPGDDPRALVDHDRVLQVLANLVSNGVKFTAKGGRVVLGAKDVDDEVVFSVADTGAGIYREGLKHAFERHWQQDPSDRRGLGLGLYITRHIVEAHGGRIWAESRVGKGSTFFFTVPAIKKEAVTVH